MSIRRLLAERTNFYHQAIPESLIAEFLTANGRKWTQIQILVFIRVHWRVFAVLLVRLYRIKIDFDDSIRWRSPRSVSISED